MTDFPIRYDTETNTMELAGPSGAAIMLGIILKAKFGEAFDPEVLFHEPIARLASMLRDQAKLPEPAESRFDSRMLALLAERIVEESPRSGWWIMSEAERAAYVQGVVVAPHQLPAAQLRDLLDNVDGALLRRQLIVRAAEDRCDR